MSLYSPLIVKFKIAAIGGDASEDQKNADFFYRFKSKVRQDALHLCLLSCSDFLTESPAAQALVERYLSETVNFLTDELLSLKDSLDQGLIKSAQNLRTQVLGLQQVYTPYMDYRQRMNVVAPIASQMLGNLEEVLCYFNSEAYRALVNKQGAQQSYEVEFCAMNMENSNALSFMPIILNNKISANFCVNMETHLIEHSKKIGEQVRLAENLLKLAEIIDFIRDDKTRELWKEKMSLSFVVPNLNTLLESFQLLRVLPDEIKKIIESGKPSDITGINSNLSSLSQHFMQVNICNNSKIDAEQIRHANIMIEQYYESIVGTLNDQIFSHLPPRIDSHIVN